MLTFGEFIIFCLFKLKDSLLLSINDWLSILFESFFMSNVFFLIFVGLPISEFISELFFFFLEGITLFLDLFYYLFFEI